MQGGVSLTQNILKKGKPGPFLFLVAFNAFIKQSITGFFLPFQNKILPTANFLSVEKIEKIFLNAAFS